ncbi:hypothetical protein MNV49_006510 [Pseudohyphozyma bogoriensis]|nr:hypothetical protein MNV49_006510 [Pseudohyphozyma bogoriensis]
MPASLAGSVINGIPYETREHWMKVANDAVAVIGPSPCPWSPFGTVIVEHHADGHDEEWCQGINVVQYTGNPQLHGEASAFRNCTAIMTAKGMTADEINKKWHSLSLYTNGEPCPQCMSSIRYAGLKEVVWGSSIASIYGMGRPQILVSSYEINEKSLSMGTNNESAPCPAGCERVLPAGERVMKCEPTDTWLIQNGKK